MHEHRQQTTVGCYARDVFQGRIDVAPIHNGPVRSVVVMTSPYRKQTES